MTRYLFRSNYSIVGHIPAATGEVIQAEPMLYQASYAYAWEKGSTLTRQVLGKLPEEVRQGWVIDTRVHMLMPGHYPAMPQWHADGLPRSTSFPDGFQPDLRSLEEPVNHFTVTLSDQSPGVSLTKYLDEDLEVELGPRT